ncbi:hypothetical protein FA13DRAFT_1792643 [Coprinellus micaceus]|uniref:Small ribosomal subunit protein bS18m n=1 Tax=Coprinellus micaceus TaxID=71717 RepID=A0A4Y7T8A0_COPMI|nr:hypothetical protein FA13DRAFT_1792643 [Coprinellus micaceus]
MFAGRVTKTLRQSAPRLSASFSSKPPPATSSFSATQELFKTVSETAAKLAEEVEVSAPTVRVRALRPGFAIRPHQLAYDNRVIDRSAPRPRRPTVAPASKQARDGDIFYQLGVDPVSIATNASVLSKYITEMGQIQPRTQTRLTVKSQRRLGKAIRRARMMGVIPILSRISND